MNQKEWISILQEEKNGIIKENQWKIFGFLIFIIPLLLFIIYYFINKEDPIIPRIFDGLFLSLILLIIVIVSFIVPAFLFWEAVCKINSLNKMKDEILTKKFENEDEIIKEYERIIHNNRQEKLENK